jgi:Rrf2 family nitric oxide-sensitive transcriptional repressor
MLSQTIEYALRAMIRLATLAPGEALTSELIAAHTGAPKGYLSKILRDLVVSGLVSSQRGPAGGFALARPAAEISMLDVINAVDPIQRIRKCPLGNPSHLQLCPLHRRVDDALGVIEREFERTSLIEVLESNAKAKGQCRALAPVRVEGRLPRS